jgi:3D (Asp-Asp-Asp) domain-containing protein
MVRKSLFVFGLHGQLGRRKRKQKFLKFRTVSISFIYIFCVKTKKKKIALFISLSTFRGKSRELRYMFLAAVRFRAVPQKQTLGPELFYESIDISQRLRPPESPSDSWHVFARFPTKKMMRYLYSVCLLIGALGLPAAAQASSAKGTRGGASQTSANRTVVVHADTAAPARRTPAPTKSEARDAVVAHMNQDNAPTQMVAMATGYVSPVERLRREAEAAGRSNQTPEIREPSSKSQTALGQTNITRTSAPPPTVASRTNVKSISTANPRTNVASTSTEKARTVESSASKSSSRSNEALTTTDSTRSSIRSASTASSRPNFSPTIAALSACTDADAPANASGGRLARVTAYWACEGDYYTRHGISATGVRLHDGHCAVDPNIIPYGSVVTIAGVGKFLAVDTGSAVISRTAAREGGHTSAERNAIVVDVFFADRDEGERFASSDAKWAPVSWWTPTSTASQAKQARSLFAEEDWTKINGKQL